MTDETGGVIARLSVDGAEFWLADESPQPSNFSLESLGGGSVRMALIVEDPVRFLRERSPREAQLSGR